MPHQVKGNHPHTLQELWGNQGSKAVVFIEDVTIQENMDTICIFTKHKEMNKPKYKRRWVTDARS